MTTLGYISLHVGLVVVLFVALCIKDRLKEERLEERYISEIVRMAREQEREILVLRQTIKAFQAGKQGGNQSHARH